MTEPIYIQTCALPDICSRCGEHGKVAEARYLMTDNLVTRACLECLDQLGYV